MSKSRIQTTGFKEIEKGLNTVEEDVQNSSEAKYKAVFDSVSDAVFIHDPDTGAILEVNRKMTEMYGYTADEARSITIEDISSGIPPYNQEGAVERIRDAARQGCQLFEWECRDKSGRLFWTEVNLNQTVIGGHVRVVATVHEITNRKIFERDLRESETRFRTLHEASFGGIGIHDKGLILDCNQALADMTGYAIEELIGMDGLQLIAPGWRDQVLRNILRGYDRAYDVEGVRKDGSVFPLEIRGKNIPYHGRTVRVTEFRDITERKRAEEEREKLIRQLEDERSKLEAALSERKRIEEALQESEETYRSLFESSIDGIMLTNPYGNIIYAANPAACRILGRTEEEIIRAGRDEITDTTDARFQTCLEERARTGSFRGELIQKRKDGTKYPVDISTSLMKDRHGQPRASVIFRDITERKQAEEELRRYQEKLEDLVKERTIELEDKNRKLKEEMTEREKAQGEKRKIETQLAQTQRIEALDRFAGGIAHDLNNILYPIIINIEGLLEEEPYNSARHEILDQTLKAAYRQRDLVKKILSFSRQSERVSQPVGVKALLEETVNFLRSSLPSTICIQQNIDALIDVVMGDPVQIQQVIVNLCKNAADAYASGKGTVEVRLANAHMKSMHGHQDIHAGEYLKLTVKDAGQGMRPEVMDRIFEPFFTNKGLGKGTGMGLSVVHGIVKSHGGNITVESEEGKGSVFTVYFPVSDAQQQVQPPHADYVPSVKGKEKILLVDDEEFILSSLQRTLKSSGYRVTAVQDGPEAFKAFRENPDEFDLVITDLTMPGMTGLELSRKIQLIRPDVPIILCTGFNDVIDGQEARSYGIKELLLKPVGTGELRKGILRALES